MLLHNILNIYNFIYKNFKKYFQDEMAHYFSPLRKHSSENVD